jgi:flavorubredoxin
MKKILIAYFSSSGKAETMAQYIAEGVRFSGQQAVLRKMPDIAAPTELDGYDGYIFGSPTFSLDLPKPVKVFLSLARQAPLDGKLGGAFGSYRHDVSYQHDAYAPALILTTLQNELKMEPFDLGPFNLKEDVVETPDGMKACQDYGRVFGERLG